MWANRNVDDGKRFEDGKRRLLLDTTMNRTGVINIA